MKKAIWSLVSDLISCFQKVGGISTKMEELITVLLATLVYFIIALVFFGLCYLWNLVLYPPKEEPDVEGGRRNTEKAKETKF